VTVPKSGFIEVRGTMREASAAGPPTAVLRIQGMPIEAMWYVNTLEADRRTPITARLYRFLSSPDAMQAMFRADGRVPASKFKPPIYVTIWS
jgi:LysR family transcriptional regulator, low CO2-responsive transcriptional regulator